jgi:hypothetical protein
LVSSHAVSFGVLDYASIERILAARSQPRSLNEYVAEESTRRLQETLGYARTERRDLTEYDRLPVTTVSRSQDRSRAHGQAKRTGRGRTR